MPDCFCISCLALALLPGCTGYETAYETDYVDGGSAGALTNSAASRAGDGANAGAGSNGQASASAGTDNHGGASAAGSDAGTAHGGAASGVGGLGDRSGGTGGIGGIGGQAASPAAGEAGSAGAAECLRSSDCPSGMSCSATEQCVTEPCTDADCGGACPPCNDGQKCLADTDCTSYACDAALQRCTANQCEDHQQDGLETDTDCGGGLCPACALDKSCLVSSDCASQACDGAALVCVADVCSDHRKDGDETDADCGGATCDPCIVGKKCNSSFDCVAGHYCNTLKVCQ